MSLVFIALLESGLSCSIALESSTLRQAVFSCGALGLGLPIIGAYLLQKATTDFENWSLVPGALIMGVPNAVGGALAGWIQWRWKVRFT